MAEHRIVLLLPGQGGQYPKMGAGLYGHDPTVTAAMDEVFTLLGRFGEEVRSDWLTDRPAVPLDHVSRSQILIFALDYAIGSLILSWGVRPAGVLGHSVGEIAAAALAGVFTIADATALMRDRVEVLESAPAGGMLAVAASADEVADFAGGDVAIGAVNAPRRTVLSGPAEALALTAQRLRNAGFVGRSVAATCPFHSPVLRPHAAASLPAITMLARRRPRLPLYSGYSGGLMPASCWQSPAFWAMQPADPVYFWPALDELIADLGSTPGPVPLLVEAGPGDVLSTSARAHPAVVAGNVRVANPLPPRPASPDAERAAIRALRERLLEPSDSPAALERAR